MPGQDEDRLSRVLSACAEAIAEGKPPPVESLCAGSPELESAVRRRLAGMSAIDDALGLSEPQREEHGRAPGVGTTVGAYELVRAIGEGGFGVVYEARRRDGLLGRFAVKVLLRAAYSENARARFANEGRALAIVRHDSIASVIDAGLSESGAAYLVMDYIEGRPLTAFCAEHGLPLRDRLELFLEACAAVEHAHAKGVIHRDLKPGNILARHEDGRHRLKVIDFGIARIADADQPTAARFTEEGEIIGTAAYMSPEQLGAVRSDPDTRSDIYSLGVVLYELATGWLPYQRAQGEAITAYELQRRLRGPEPVSIGARLRTTGTTGRFERELGWIAARCLEIEPDRRYATCRELSDDLRRLLRGEALTAGPRSRTYLARKFIGRHRVGVVMSGVVLVAVLGAGAVANYGLVRAASEGRRAIAAEADTELIAEFQADRLGSVDPASMGERIRSEILASLSRGELSDSDASPLSPEMLEGVAFSDVATRVLQSSVFEPALDEAGTQFEDRPEIRGRLMRSIGEAQVRIGLLAEGLETLEGASDLLREHAGPAHTETLLALRERANTLTAAGRADEAEPILREVIAGLSASEGAEALDTLVARNDLGMSVFNTGRIEEAAEAMIALAGDCAESLGESHQFTATVRGNLGDILDHLGRLTEAEAHHRAAAVVLEAQFGRDHHGTLVMRNNLGKNLAMQGRFEEALPVFEDVSEASRRELGDMHPTTMLALSNLAVVLINMGRFEEGLAVNEEVLRTRTAVLGPDHPTTIVSINTKASVLVQLERYEEAVVAAELAVERARVVFGPDRYETGVFRGVLGSILAKVGRRAEAAAEMQVAHEIMLNTVGAGSIYITRNAEHAALLHREWEAAEPGAGHAEEAARWQSIVDAAQVPAEGGGD